MKRWRRKWKEEEEEEEEEEEQVEVDLDIIKLRRPLGSASVISLTSEEMKVPEKPDDEPENMIDDLINEIVFMKTVAGESRSGGR